MAIFSLAIPTILRREGGFVDNKLDEGGATNFGISLRWLRTIQSDATIDDIRNMTEDRAQSLYRTYWWNRYQYGNIFAQATATKVFDMSVNMGPVTAHKILQECAGCTVDGVLGPETFGAVNSQPSIPLILKLQDAQAARYRQIVADCPQDAIFLEGWLNRAYDRN